MACVNVSIIFALNKGIYPLKQNSFEFGVELAMQLIKPFVMVRDTTRLPSIVTTRIALVIGKPPQQQVARDRVRQHPVRKEGGVMYV